MMNKKYEYEGTLRHNAQGRYSFSDRFYFTSGDRIEILDEDDETWLKGRIEYLCEYGYNDYYFISEEGITIFYLQGYKARV